LKVLFVASESVPFIKTGGLGDVIGSLPKTLKQKKNDVRVIIPLYRSIVDKYSEDLKYITDLSVQVSWRTLYCGVFELEHEGVKFYFIDNQQYFNRDDAYGYDDDLDRFAFFSKAALEILPKIKYKPDIIHAHDWHASLVPFFLKVFYSQDPFYSKIKTVFTIHNLHYQGVFGKEKLGDVIGVGEDYFHADALEYHGDINCMKAGIMFSDQITTVSETYSNEIKSPYFGEGLEGVLNKRADDLKGIINGIDYELYNPETDKNIPQNFDVKTFGDKEINKVKLQRELGLEVDSNIPMVAVISRLVEAKGVDLILHVMEELLHTRNFQMVILGSGERRYEDSFRYMENNYKKKVVSYIGFRVDLSHRIYGAADMLLMPSRFEPCGLSQLIALRYGTVPIVRETGGLNDTVFSYSEENTKGNGFTFTNYNAHDFMNVIRTALDYYEDKKAWKQVVKNAMKSDYSWNKSAKEYIELYKKLYKNKAD
jgi:starch synthase